MFLPSAAKVAKSGVSLSFRHQSSLPVAHSHKRTVQSPLAERSQLPSGDNATDDTPLRWPFGGSICLPLPASQKETAPSHPPEAMIRLSGEKAMVSSGA